MCIIYIVSAICKIRSGRYALHTTFECLDGECIGLDTTNDTIFDSFISKLRCVGEDSCQFANIVNVSLLECLGKESCQSATLTNISMISCGDENACNNANFQHVTRLECIPTNEHRLRMCKHIKAFDISQIKFKIGHPMENPTIISGNNSTMSLDVKSYDDKKGLDRFQKVFIKDGEIHCVNHSTCTISARHYSQRTNILCDKTSVCKISIPGQPRVIPFPMQKNCFPWYLSIILQY